MFSEAEREEHRQQPLERDRRDERSLAAVDLGSAFGAAGDALIAQALQVDRELGARLEPVIRLLTETAQSK